MAGVDVDELYYEILKTLAAQIPEMAAAFLGIVFSLAKWRKYPRPALLSFLGFGLLLVVNIIFEVVQILVLRGVLFDLSLIAGNGELFFLSVWAVRSFLVAGAYLLLIFAIDAARRPQAPLPPHLPDTRLREIDR